MQFEINKELIEQIKELIHHGKDDRILELLGELHSVEVAEIFEMLRIEEAVYVYRILDNEITAEAILELDEYLQEKILQRMLL